MDKYELALQEKKEELLKCQKEKQLTSCLKCKDVLECKIRDNYVKAVYESMSKGETGGFEF